MADTALTEGYRCGYCYQERNSMTEPKILPCQHVFCLLCLQKDVRKNGNISCLSCQTIHELENLEKLTTATLNVEEVVSNTTTTSLTCDCHNCVGQTAVSYCVDCAHRICDTHMQMHDPLFGDSHQLLPIYVYEMSPGQYNRVVCEQHKAELERACSKCDTLVCKECDLYTGQCPDNNTRHKFSSFNQLKEEITSHFNKLLKSASGKLTEICKLDKEMWRTLDYEEVQCKEKIEMIERVRDEQIAAITEETERLKELVHGYQRKLTNQVEAYNSELMAKKEQLEDIRTKAHRLVKYAHMSEIIKQRHEITGEMTQHLGANLICELMNSPVLICKAEHSLLGVSLVNFPTSLTLKSEYDTGSECYSACHREDGSLLLGCWNGVQLFRPSKQEATQYITGLTSVTVVAHQPNIFLLHHADRTRKIKICLPGTTAKQTLFEFKQSRNMVLFLAVSDRYVATTNRDDKNIILYDFTTEQTTTLHSNTASNILHFLPDGDLLATGFHAPCLTRYKVTNGQLTAVWTCQGLNDSCGVCNDSYGLIYVASWSQRTVYIISPDGVKLQELSCDKLPANAGQISIRGDELAVAGWRDKKVHLYKINR